MSTAAPTTGAGVGDDSAKTKRKKRVKKSLPPEIAKLTDKDKDKFIIALEKDPNKFSSTYGEEFDCAQKVKISRKQDQDGNKATEEEFDIVNGLNLDQHRQMCANLGIKACGSSNLFQCRKAIGILCRYAQGLEDAGLLPGSDEARRTNTICRAVNVCFSTSFIDQFMKLNDIKNRKDHESGTTYKKFWIDAADMHNAVDNEDDDDLDAIHDEIYKIVNPDNDEYVSDLEMDLETNLKSVDSLTAAVFKERILSCFKIRRQIQKNMTNSGTHNSEVWGFVQAALKEGKGITKNAAYYFYMRCEENKEVDATFCPFMAEELKGGTKDLADEASSGPPSKKQALAILQETNTNVQELLTAFKESNEKKETMMQKQLHSQETMMQKQLHSEALATYMKLATSLTDTNLPPATKDILTSQMKKIAEEHNFE